MKNKIIIIAAIVVGLLTLIPAALGNGNPAHIWLNSVNNFPEDQVGGYVTSDPNFDLYIRNEAKYGVQNLKLFVSIPGSTEGILPTQTITLNGNQINNWHWGKPCAFKEGGVEFCMPNSGTFPTYWASVDLGSVDAETTLLAGTINIVGTPPVRFDAWGFDTVNNQEILKLIDPFSHNLTYVPEFPTVALPIAAIIGLVFFFQHRRNKEE